jgi:hypothetical protein
MVQRTKLLVLGACALVACTVYLTYRSDFNSAKIYHEVDSQFSSEEDAYDNLPAADRSAGADHIPQSQIGAKQGSDKDLDSKDKYKYAGASGLEPSSQEDLDPSSPVAFLLKRAEEVDGGAEANDVQARISRIMRMRSIILKGPPDYFSEQMESSIRRGIYSAPEGSQTTLFPVLCRSNGCEVQLIDHERGAGRSLIQKVAQSSLIASRLSQSSTEHFTINGQPAYIVYFTFKN